MKEGKRWHRHGRFSPLAIAGMVIGGLALAVLFAFLFGWIVMLLWNWLMPAIFGLPAIGYWQGWGLVLLSHILIKGGWGSPGGGPGKKKKGCGGHWYDDEESLEKALKNRFRNPECDVCAWRDECAKYERCWRRTADGWKCDSGDVKPAEPGDDAVK